MQGGGSCVVLLGSAVFGTHGIKCSGDHDERVPIPMG